MDGPCPVNCFSSRLPEYATSTDARIFWTSTNQTPGHAERDYTCHILRLSIEIRLVIYRHLLLYGCPDVDNQLPLSQLLVGRVHPAILQTCKQIYDEARSISYDENTVFAGIQVQDIHNFGVAVHTRVHHHVVEPTAPTQLWLNLPMGIFSFPEILTIISRLQVYVGARGRGEICTRPLNAFLCTLASFLMMRGHRLKTLYLMVDFSADYYITNAMYSTIFPPAPPSLCCRRYY